MCRNLVAPVHLTPGYHGNHILLKQSLFVLKSWEVMTNWQGMILSENHVSIINIPAAT